MKEMDKEKARVLALAVNVVASMIEYAVVMAVQYMEIMGDDSVSDQVRQGCVTVLAQLDAIQASAIFHDSRKRKRKLKSLARKKLFDLDSSAMPRVTSQESYQCMFRMDSGAFQWFCEQVGPFVEKMNTNYKKSIPVAKRVAVALFRLATGANYLFAAERFCVGESTVFYCTMELCEILCSRFRHMVGYPQGNTLKKVMAGFKAVSGLPNCVGAIGCTHLQIKRPTGPESADYLNEDEVHTIVTQAAVDSSTRVLSLATGFTGAVSDQRILSMSSLHENIESGRFFNIPTMEVEGVNVPSYLVGNSSYELKPWLMVPYPTEELTAFEDVFNKYHYEACQMVDKTFDTLKKWGILSKVTQVDVPTAVQMIGAVCIIHNMLLDKLDPFGRGTLEEDFSLEIMRQEVDVTYEDVGERRHAHAVRDALTTHLITM